MKTKIKNTFEALHKSLTEKHGFKQTFEDPFICRYEKPGKVAYIYYMGNNTGYRIRCYNVDKAPTYQYMNHIKRTEKP